MKRLILVLAALICLAPVGFADTIVYDNGGPNLVNGGEMTLWIQADDFTLEATTTITDVHFWAIENREEDGFSGSIWYGIYTDASGQPNLGTPAVEGFSQASNLTRTATGNVIFGIYDEYEYDFDITPFDATGGATYWLGLHNGPLTHADFDQFYWETTNLNGTFLANQDLLPAGDAWLPSGGPDHPTGDFAFYLTAATPIPEPSSLLLLGGGLIGLAGIARRKLR